MGSNIPVSVCSLVDGFYIGFMKGFGVGRLGPEIPFIERIEKPVCKNGSRLKGATKGVLMSFLCLSMSVSLLEQKK